MSLCVSYPIQSLKRPRQDNDAIHQISQKFARIDQLTVQEARRVFLESDPIHFQNAIELETYGDLSNIHNIHKKAVELLDPNKRKERSVLRIIKKIPDAMPVENLLTSDQLNRLQEFFSMKENVRHLPNHVMHKRINLQSSFNSDLVIGKNNKFKIDTFYLGSEQINQIYESILGNVVQSIYDLDGEKAIGNYKVEFYITRYFEEFNPENNFPLHHDRYRGLKPYTYPRYTFVGMLSDKKGLNGWKGGDLIVQNNSSSKFEIGFQKHLPHLRYKYKENEGLLLQNQKVVHQVTHIDLENKETQMARDLLQIRFFEKTELEAHEKKNPF